MTQITESVDLRDTINDELKTQERTLAWLIRKTGIPYSTLYACLVEKRVALNLEKITAINLALGTTYTIEQA